MRKVNKLVVLLVVAAFSVGCGQWTAPLPTAPSDASRGAIISGTVNGLGRSASAIAPSNKAAAALLAVIDTATFATPLKAATGFTVTVVGTEVKAEINDSGKFVLEGVPMGNVELKFEGQGVEAKLEIKGVQPEHIQLVVTLNGSKATVDSINRVQPDNLADLEGPITSISHGDRSMKVNGLEIKIWDAPVWNGSSRVGISTLQVGDRVRVTGTVVHDYVVATEVRVGSAGPDPGPTPPPPPPPPGPTPGPGSETIDGVISSISYGDRSMKINGLEIKVRDAPIFQGGSRVGITVLQVGQRVRVTGVWEHDYIIATRVDIL
jgi:hypothetical protein